MTSSLLAHSIGQAMCRSSLIRLDQGPIFFIGTQGRASSELRNVATWSCLSTAFFAVLKQLHDGPKQ